MQKLLSDLEFFDVKIRNLMKISDHFVLENDQIFIIRNCQDGDEKPRDIFFRNFFKEEKLKLSEHQKSSETIHY